MTLVIDASALLALLREEPGADLVAQHVRHSAISTVNLTEVIEIVEMHGGNAGEVIAAVARLEVDIIPFAERHSVLAAAYRPRVKGKNISLADRCCWALAAALESPVLTGDRDWVGLDHGLEIKPIR